MGNLFSYLDEIKWNNLFEVSEGSHIIPHTYNVIKAAVRNRADKLILTSTEFIWSRQGTILGRFPTTYPVAPLYSFRQALVEILLRDETVKQHLKIISETEAELVCEFQIEELNPN